MQALGPKLRAFFLRTKRHFGYWDLLRRRRSINATPCNSPLLTCDLLFLFLGKYLRMEHLQRQGCCPRKMREEVASGIGYYDHVYITTGDRYIYLHEWLIFRWCCSVNICKYRQVREFYALRIVSMAWDGKPLPGCNRGILKPQNVLVSVIPFEILAIHFEFNLN